MSAPVPIGARVIGAYHVFVGGVNFFALILLLIAVFSTVLVAPPFFSGAVFLVLFSMGLVFFGTFHMAVGVGLFRANRKALLCAILLSGLLTLWGLVVGAAAEETVGFGSCVFHGAMTAYLLFSKKVHAAFRR